MFRKGKIAVEATPSFNVIANIVYILLKSILFVFQSSQNVKSMHTLYLDNYHIDWVSINDVFLYKDAHAHRAIRNIVRKLGVPKVCYLY